MTVPGGRAPAGGTGADGTAAPDEAAAMDGAAVPGGAAGVVVTAGVPGVEECPKTFDMRLANIPIMSINAQQHRAGLGSL